jgi:GTP cyclohydrolase II
MEEIEALLGQPADFQQATGRPFVTLSYAQSLDGCIAARRGQPLALSGPQSLAMTHRLRAAHQAILVGIGTLLADDPQLTVRLAEGPQPQPVIVDSHLRFPPQARLLRNHPRSPWIATSQGADPVRQQVLEGRGARILRLPANAASQVCLAALLEELGASGITSLMVEGGAGVITSFLREGLVDLLVLTISPVLVGGFHAVNRLGEPDTAHFPRLSPVHCKQLDEDVILWGKLAE